MNTYFPQPLQQRLQKPLQDSLQYSVKAFRSSFLDCVEDPFYISVQESIRYIPDGLLVIENGKVIELGSYEHLKEKYAAVPVTSYSGKLITPGFIDLHIHFPQTGMIAAYGEQLLEWLDKYTFPTESKFKDNAYAQQVATVFLDELLRNGTTTAVVLAAVYPESVDAFFEEASRRRLCMIAGKVMMDRNAPDFLLDTAETSYHDSKHLIEKWHGNDRLLYAITPRFSITSTDEQLRLAGKLLNEHSGLYMHSHLSENLDEIEFVQQLFPGCKNYLDTYDRAGLVGERSIFAHGIHLTDEEFQRLSETKAAIAFCPTSNLFLGSGLFKLERAKSLNAPIKVGLGTDVGAGTSFSLLQTANEAYKAAQLQKQTLSPFQALFLATLGGARALCLDDTIGSFKVGNAADFVVLDARATPIMAFRNPDATPATLDELADRLFSLVMMGDDRAIVATYILGNLAYERSSV